MLQLMNLPKITDLEVSGKKVLVRGDFDVDDGDNPRANSIRNIVCYLKEKGAAKIKVIGHSETDYNLALVLGKEFPNVEFDSSLRQNKGEKENSLEFAQKLAQGWDIFVNEYFAT